MIETKNGKRITVISGIIFSAFFSVISTIANCGLAFAEVPNGRVDSESIPEPSENINTTEQSGNETNEAGAVESGAGDTTASEAGIEATPEESTEGEDGSASTNEGELTTELVTEIDMLPVYLSLGGIALTVLLIIIINIVHRKPKQ